MRRITNTCIGMALGLSLLLGQLRCEPSAPREPASEATSRDGSAGEQAQEQPSVREQPSSPEPRPTEPRPPEAKAPEPKPEAPKKSCASLCDGMKVQVRSIVDGDTVYVYPAGQGRTPYYRIRMWGYNSPECKKGNNTYGYYGCVADDEGYGLKAYESLIQLIHKKGLVLTVSCPEKGKDGGQVCSKDPYERYLAYLLLPNGDNVALKMLEAGAGWVYTIYYPPLLEQLCRAEAKAIQTKAGMWKQGRDSGKANMNRSTRSWYDHSNPRKTHDAICSDAMGESFKKVAGEE